MGQNKRLITGFFLVKSVLTSEPRNNQITHQQPIPCVIPRIGYMTLYVYAGKSEDKIGMYDKCRALRRLPRAPAAAVNLWAPPPIFDDRRATDNLSVRRRCHVGLINKPFHSSSFRYRLTYIDRYVTNSRCVMRTGYFLSQPIMTLENVSYISLAQPGLKKLWIISQTCYLTVAIISGQCQYM